MSGTHLERVLKAVPEEGDPKAISGEVAQRPERHGPVAPGPGEGRRVNEAPSRRVPEIKVSESLPDETMRVILILSSRTAHQMSSPEVSFWTFQGRDP